MLSREMVTALCQDDETMAEIMVNLLFGYYNDNPQEEEIMPDTNSTALDMIQYFYYTDPCQLTVKQLREIASGMNIKGIWNMSKMELIEALAEHEPKDVDPDTFTVLNLSLIHI